MLKTAGNVKTKKVLFVSYPSSFQNVGGGEILLLKLKEFLEKEDVEIKLFDMWQDRIEDYDLVHIFGSVKDCLGVIQVAKARGVKVVTSPIFWSSWTRAFHTFGGWQERLQLTLRHATKILLPAFPSSRRKMLVLSDLIFPNSEMEKDQLHRFFHIPKEKMEVIYNGVDAHFINATPELFRQRVTREDFILSVGRIEPRKNQLNLIRAAKRLGTKLVLIGSPVSGFDAYNQICRKEGYASKSYWCHCSGNCQTNRCVLFNHFSIKFCCLSKFSTIIS